MFGDKVEHYFGRFLLLTSVMGVLADAGYGLSAPFRQGLTARSLAWAVGIPRHLKVYPVGVRLIWPIAGRGRPRQRHVPNILSMAAEDAC